MTSLVKQPKTEVGALLPDTDPTIAEMVVNTLNANPTAHPAEILVALVKGAPHPEVAVEFASALMELLICKEKGHVYWLDMRGHMILTGVRTAAAKDGIAYGPAHWPHQALVVGPPKSAVVRVSGDQVRRIWMACEPLEGVVIRQSEAVALGNAMIELFGGRILEDRQGPEVLRQAAIEQNFTKRAKLRAQANAKRDALVVEGKAEARLDHARVPCAEALPGSLRQGDRLVPERKEGDPRLAPVYEVEERVNESWVVLVAVEPGFGSVVGADLWVREDGRKVDPSAPEHYAGFSDEPSIVRRERQEITMPGLPASLEVDVPAATVETAEE